MALAFSSATADKLRDSVWRYGSLHLMTVLKGLLVAVKALVVNSCSRSSRAVQKIGE